MRTYIHLFHVKRDAKFILILVRHYAIPYTVSLLVVQLAINSLYTISTSLEY